MLSEKAIEGTSVRNAALFDNKPNGFIGGDEQVCGMAYAVHVDEIGGSHSCTFMQGLA